MLERAVQAFFSMWTDLALAFPGGSYVEDAGVARARTLAPVPGFNGVWARHDDVRTDDVLAAVDDFAAGDLPWNVQLRPGYPDDLDDALEERGLVVAADVPFMVLPDITTLDDSSALAFRDVVTFDDVDVTLRLLEQGFGMPAELTRGIMPVRLLFMGGATTWIASADGDGDVSTALAVVNGDMCGIFNVATPPEHRGKGHGAAVTARATIAATADGARSAYLQSSPMGFSVYERLGFQTKERWRQWMPKEFVDLA